MWQPQRYFHKPMPKVSSPRETMIHSRLSCLMHLLIPTVHRAFLGGDVCCSGGVDVAHSEQEFKMYRTGKASHSGLVFSAWTADLAVLDGLVVSADT